MHITYLSGDSACTDIGVEDIEVRAFSTLDDSEVLTDVSWRPGNCLLEILYQDGKYWVISIPSVGITDTLRVENPGYLDSECVEIRYLLVEGDYYINGQVHNFPVFDRIY